MFYKIAMWLSDLSEYFEKKHRVREWKKRKRERDNDVVHAQKVLNLHGVTYDAEWMDISYRGEKYRPIMLEQDTNQLEEELIIITAKKIK